MGRHRRGKPGWSAMVTIALLAATGCSPIGSTPTTSATPRPTGPAQAIIGVGQRPGVPAAGDAAVWVPNTGDGTISRIDPGSNRVTAPLPIGHPPPLYLLTCQ